MQSKLVVVLGMHRSGTSAITRGLMAMGIDLGGNLMRPVQGSNEKGFWEDLDIYALNMEMLGFLNKKWHSILSLSSIDFEALEQNGYFTRAIRLLEEKVSGGRVFGFKDPRTARLLYFWKSVFAQMQLDVHYIVCVRNPLSVCRSLEKRDELDVEKSSLLWIGHAIDALSGTNGEKRIIVDYDKVMISPSEELSRIADAFGFVIDAGELEIYEDNFLDKGLQHTVYEAKNLLSEKAIHPLAYDIYVNLLLASEYGAYQNSSSFTSQVIGWRDEFERQRTLLTYTERVLSEIAEKDAQLGKSVINTERLERELGDIQASNLWRLMLIIRAVRLRLIPAGSRREAFVKRWLRGYQAIRNEFFNKFWLA